MYSLQRCAAYRGLISGMSPKDYQLIQSTDYYPLLLFYVGTSDTVRSSLRSVKKNYRVLGVMVRNSGAQVVLPSILPVKGKGFERTSQICRVNKWLQGWCHRHGFGYLDHGTHFEKPGVLGADEVHLSEKEKSIFVDRLPKLVKRSLQFLGEGNLNPSQSAEFSASAIKWSEPGEGSQVSRRAPSSGAMYPNKEEVRQKNQEACMEEQ
ncbi:hypothetical protein llap_8032 [Limosa lapponica baueri]|uniref:Uncharacterized protein n=1 Tax=Limosa lapponica baueri TaxID=1758121 RepID=A0A2I0U6G9_LIMLA|nr:hypothetical protein llap_8032 [Limosa lapponica baueri]